MTAAAPGSSLASLLLRVSVVAVLAALLATLAQRWLVGEVHAGVTGGVVGGICAAFASRRRRAESGKDDAPGPQAGAGR
jgi:hypothetical protein